MKNVLFYESTKSPRLQLIAVYRNILKLECTRVSIAIAPIMESRLLNNTRDIQFSDNHGFIDCFWSAWFTGLILAATRINLLGKTIENTVFKTFSILSAETTRKYCQYLLVSWQCFKNCFVLGLHLKLTQRDVGKISIYSCGGVI